MREAHVPAEHHHSEAAARLPEPSPYTQRPKCATKAKTQKAPGVDSMTTTTDCVTTFSLWHHTFERKSPT